MKVRTEFSSGLDTNVLATGATTERTIEDQWADVKNVIHFGAVGDGVVDDSTAIQAAIDALPSGGGMVFFPAGTYLISAALIINRSDVRILGSGIGNTTITTNSTTADVFTLGDGASAINDIMISDLVIAASVTKTAGAGVNFNEVRTSGVYNLRIGSLFNAIRIQNNSIIIWARDLDIRNVVPTTGVGIFIDGGHDHYLSGIVIDNPSGSQPLAGIRVQSDSALFLHNLEIVHSGIGLLIDPGAGQTVNWIFVDSVLLDTCSVDGIRLDAATSTSSLKGLTFLNCWTATNDLHGVNIQGVSGGILDGIFFNSHKSFVNKFHGYRITFGQNIAFDNCQASGNSVDTTNTSDGFTFGAGVSEWSIRNCKSGQLADFANSQNAGIDVLAGASDNYQIVGNDLRGNATIGLRDGGTGSNKQIYGNLPFADVDNFVLGAGAAITRHLSATAVLDFPNTASQSRSILDITVTGAAVGDTVVLGIAAASQTNGVFQAWVQATNVVRVSFLNTSTAAIDPASGTFRVDVWKHA